jgi:hypothetical protein
MFRTLVVVAFLCISNLYAQTPSTARDSFKSVQFLIGNWEAKTQGGKFEIRPPGQTEFKSYREWSGDKK